MKILVLIFAAFAAVVTGKAVQPSGYKVEVKHDHYPVKRHGDFHHQHHIPVLELEHHNAPESQDYFAYPSYKFEYGVKDPKTGDHKSQWEIRDGDVVKGEYTVDEPDGTKRVVSYHADDKSGFNAIVKKIGKAHHPQDFQQPFY